MVTVGRVIGSASSGPLADDVEQLKRQAYVWIRWAQAVYTVRARGESSDENDGCGIVGSDVEACKGEVGEWR